MSYIDLYRTGELVKMVSVLKESLEPCRLCPRECGASRLSGERGQCGAGKDAEISGFGPHFGEEPPLVGGGGSGTIFFAFCSLRCVFCQNFETSRGMDKYAVNTTELAEIMLKLQERGCVNINLVTPTHYIPQILDALLVACENGLKLPLVYNCSGYERLEILRQLAGIVDIYMPDIKYADSDIALKYSQISDYPRVAKEALKEMHQQVGDLVLDKEGIAIKGLLIRHLVMPGGLAGTASLMKFIAEEISPKSWINIMNQYYPTYLAHRYPEINRRITYKEYLEALKAAEQASPDFNLL
ncbi:MAG: radical SAM protein [Thermacetogeniaceae bacterium]|jgi:putative pyruvate formate lyase activating enzyme|nr:radical SAM protein [Syntrophomonadaceae bacterium]